MAGSLNLYELSSMLTDALAAAMEKIDPDTGEIPEDWASFLDAIDMERNTKLLNCGALYKSWDREAEAIRTEERLLAARRRSLENRAERIKEWMRSNMKAGEKLSDSRCLLSWRRSVATEITDAALVPDEYVRVERIVEKSAVKAALQEGKEVPGAKLVENANLQIK
jgi:predicted ATPase with chaperone activity